MMTDAELDQLIEMARPNLREALRRVIDAKSPAQTFPIGKIPLPAGEWVVHCLILNEPFAQVAYATLFTGVPGMMESFAKATAQPGAVAPPPAQKSNLGVPGA